MAVTDIAEVPEGQQSTFENGREQHVRVFRVKCSSVEDGTPTALNASVGTYGQPGYRAVPAYMEQYPGLENVLCVRKAAQRESGTSKHYLVTCEYRYVVAMGEGVNDPMSRPPDIRYNPGKRRVPYFMDCSSTPKPTVNAAGEPFENYLERDESDQVITYTVNWADADFDPVALGALKDTVNNAAVTIDGVEYATGTLKLDPFAASKVTEKLANGTVVTYYQITFTIGHMPGGWKDKPLNVGYNELSSGQLKPIVDATGMKVKRPWPLTSTGAKKTNATDVPDALEFKPYAEASWAILELA